MSQADDEGNTKPPEGGTTTERGLPALVYKGEVIHERHEMLSLTDMWRASGSDKSRQPSEWLASSDAKRFIDALSLILKPENSGFDLVTTKRGGRTPGTWANWQIALAYAKYLSPEFHMWCNTVVRERMEGAAHHAVGISEDDRRAIGGIAKSVVVKALAEMVPDIVHTAVVAILGERTLAHAFDPGDTVTAYQMIAMAGIPIEDRQRGTAQMVANRMLRLCASKGIACRRVPAEANPARPCLFPTAVANEWLFREAAGAEMIRNQVDRMKARKARKGRVTGQAALALVAPTQGPST